MSRRRVIKESNVKDLERTPEGRINNCALANGDEAKNCQMCGGDCPDAKAPTPIAKLEGTASRVVADVSAQLASALESSAKEAEQDERESARKRSRGVLFESANAPKPPEVSPGLAKVVERVFLAEEEIERAYEFVNQNLKLGEKLAEHGHLVKALDLGETVHRIAHRLYITAKLDRSTWERDSIITFASLREEATRHLQSEKTRGIRSKQITDADVESTCAWMFPDEWRTRETTRDRLKLTEDSLLNLVEVCASRCRTLQTLLGRSR